MVSRKEIKLQIGTNLIQTGADYDWNLLSIKGDDYMDADVSIEDYASGDGGYIKNTRYNPRYIDMHIRSKVTSDALIDATELLLKSYVDSKIESTLTVYKNGVERIGYGRIADVKKPSGAKWYETPYIIVTFLMPDPWFVGEQQTDTFVSETALMCFPLSFITGVGLTTGAVTTGNEITFTMAGHEESGFVATLTASGAVVNPTITNQDGDYIKVLKTLADGDIITISTVRGDKYVRFNGTYCKYDRLSTFFCLEVGSNTITVSADSGVADLSKQLDWRERYRG